MHSVSEFNELNKVKLIIFEIESRLKFKLRLKVEFTYTTVSFINEFNKHNKNRECTNSDYLLLLYLVLIKVNSRLKGEPENSEILRRLLESNYIFRNCNQHETRQ